MSQRESECFSKSGSENGRERFLMSRDVGNFDQGIEFCEGIGGEIASILSEDENDAAVELIAVDDHV